MTSEQREKRWLWWGQARDAVAAAVGVGLITTETVRGTYNTTAMLCGLACLGVVGTGVLSRWLIGRWSDEKNGGQR